MKIKNIAMRQSDGDRPKFRVVKRNGSGEYTSEQLHQAAEKARLEERAKLRQRIEKLERMIAGGGSAIKKEVEKAQSKKLRRLEEQVEALSARRLTEIRRELEERYGGQLIDQLLVGESEEELEESAAESHQEWIAMMQKAGVEVEDVVSEEEVEETDEEEASEEETDENEEDDEDGIQDRHVNKFKKTAGIHKSQPVIKQKLQERAARRMPSVPVPGDRSGVRRSDPDSALRGVKSMSMAEYRAKRPEILRNLKTRYANGQGAFV